MAASEYIVSAANLRAMADAIREKTGQAGLITPNQMAAAIAAIPSGGGVEVEPLNATENGVYTAPEGTAYSPVTVAVDTDEWQRPADWPDLDGIQLSEELVYDLYLTYDLRKVDWPAFISLQDNGGTHTLERGHLEDGVFVSDESVSQTTWNTFKQALDGSHGDVQLFRYRCTQACPFGFSNFDCWVASMQPCVEMVGKIGGTVLAIADNNSFHTSFLEHVKLSGYANTWNGMYNGAYALKKLEFVDFTLGGTSAVNFNSFKDAPLTSVDFSGVTFDRVLWLQGLTNISLISINCGTARVDYLNFNGKSPTREIYVQEISNSNSVLLNNAYLLSSASLNRIIDALESTTSEKTLNLGSINQAKLTAAEIAVATGKGWTVA